MSYKSKKSGRAVAIVNSRNKLDGKGVFSGNLQRSAGISSAVLEFFTSFGWTVSGFTAMGWTALVKVCAVGGVLGAGSVVFAADGGPKHFEIQAKPLAQALMDFGAQSGVTLVAPSALTEGKQGPLVRGDLSTEEALRKLLEGSGLSFVRGEDGTISIRLQPVASAVAQTEAEPVQKSDGKESSLDLDLTPTTSLPQVVVTGSHIRGAESPSPLIRVDQEAIERSGFQSTADVINSLPQSFGGGYNATTVGTGGTNTPANPSGASSANLRGLGSESTLTLVNGYRLAYADQVNAVDLNLIPLSAVERVELVTDGASAIYGSDAVAGVVNFILKKRFDGVEARAMYGESTQGGGSQYQADVLAGNEWSSGGVLASYESSRQDPIFASQRSFTDPGVSQTSLTPRTHRDSVFISANQVVSPQVTLFTHGLYTKRSSESWLDLTPAGLTGAISKVDGNVRQYGVVAGADAKLGQNWRASLAGDFARNSTDAPSNTFSNATLLSGLAQNFNTRLTQVEGAADGPLAQLKTGPVMLAAGVAYREEAFFAKVASSSTGAVFTNVQSKRQVQSAYGELNISLVSPSDRTGLNSLSLTAAGRYDRYSDFGSSTIPKVGVTYRPAHDFVLKASWGKAFRAPALRQEFLPQSANLQLIPDPTSPTLRSLVLVRGGGNPDLHAEQAETTTFSALYSPSGLPGASLSVTYFDIDYTDRIGNPIPSLATALSNPFVNSFVIRNPGTSQLNDVLAVSQFFNFSGQPYSPSTVKALIDGRFTNAATQRVNGADLIADYRVDANAGRLDFSLNGTYLNSRQVLISGSPTQQLSGNAFYPSKLRLRAGASFERGGWSTSMFLNYLDNSHDPFAIPSESISSWTTADLQIAYGEREGFLKGVRASVVARNLFDRDPPFILGTSAGYPGLHYDTTNASAVGRFISAQLVKEW